MAKKKRAIPAGFDLGITKPDERPIRIGDYLDEIDSRPAGSAVPQAAQAAPVPEPKSQPLTEPKPKKPDPKPKSEPKAKIEEKPKAAPQSKPSTSAPRTRLNVSLEGQGRLDAIWDRMRAYGPEKSLNKSEIIEAMILATYEARDQLDLSNVRRRGKYGSATHKNFPIALAESVKRAIAMTAEEEG